MRVFNPLFWLRAVVQDLIFDFLTFFHFLSFPFLLSFQNYLGAQNLHTIVPFSGHIFQIGLLRTLKCEVVELEWFWVRRSFFSSHFPCCSMVTKIDLLQLFLWFLIKAMNSKNVLHLKYQKWLKRCKNRWAIGSSLNDFVFKAPWIA